ncbi:hypothetical protein DVA67_026250 [Solirubrobacter sp. CPCC 204708]|uniref:Uncharacterized protein n=1 Tax=Solirubrobacter deserti TaxID=2282478 RepID=A0ABT4RF99_9ACTN|nr:hypothetical protein [Solirubrobacter deserti]MBE2319496.1 hypothetical protein [Solirubrobacter deserti]MDA0137217.1 hypothetical protein [Solirubrobacter deserti]
MSLRDLLRPPPHRGPLIAAGGVALAIGVSLTVLRLQATLPIGVDAALLLAPGALLFWLGAQAPNEQGEPPAYQSVLLATGLPLVYGGLLVALGGELDAIPPNWVLITASLAVAALAIWPALERNSAISLLLSALLVGFTLAVLAPDAARRPLLLAYAIALTLASLALREPARRHAEVLIDAAGLATAALAIQEYSSGVPTPDLSAFWELVLLAAGLGLVAFGALDRSPGPAYVGVLNLLLFIASASHGTALYVWPLFLLTGGVIMLAAGLRPRRPLPPEPDPYRAGEAPLAARAERSAEARPKPR